MYRFTLELLFQIIGIGSASGLLLKNDQLNIISDNGTYLYAYEMKTSHLSRQPLTAHPAENIAKKLKPDFEAITSYGNVIYLFGSGSRENRTQMVKLDAATKKVIETRNISALYKKMQGIARINSDNFNIEGVVFTGSDWYFFNRGNGGAGKNGFFKVTGASLSKPSKISFKEIQLPEIKGVSCGFTDAIEVDGKLYFLAAAEDSNSTYQDGAVFGTLIGCIDIEKMTLDFTQQITDQHKFEGITLKHKTAGLLSFLLCEDNDSELLKSDIYELKLNR
ncbi:DUF6929 family protein [Pedobacter gandavensis]|uniref:Uncharacterized protein n=1 Tax=Pedobacter gandavensis TaxID=2679963 RepID=A0ABR6ER07_9SPHI|nr:hypothetical protein [Pedobacter gandavensis]MBB2147671.1 hypothetical protein [Pedobacter gandavensis]